MLSLAAFLAVRFSASLAGADFPDFYCAARILAEGHGNQLYDSALQHQYQARYSGRVGTLYIHPPFEAALYATVAWLPLRPAYLLWSALNLAFLAAGARRMATHALLPCDWRLCLAASLTFVPLLLCLQQGQDSLLLLWLLIFGFTSLRRDQTFSAGCWLALGLFKFQLVLPLAFVLIFSQRAKARIGFAKGFTLVALTLAALSAAISGWSVFTVYPDFLLHLQSQPFPGIIPRAMANFRGFVSLMVRDDQSSRTIAIMAILSMAALIRTLIVWKNAFRSTDRPAATQRNSDFAFAVTVIFALLVSYHLNPHDLSLTLLPIAVMLNCALPSKTAHAQPANWMLLACLALLFLPPLHLWALRAGVYAVVSLPLLALLVINPTNADS